MLYNIISQLLKIDYSFLSENYLFKDLLQKLVQQIR